MSNSDRIKVGGLGDGRERDEEEVETRGHRKTGQSGLAERRVWLGEFLCVCFFVRMRFSEKKLGTRPGSQNSPIWSTTWLVGS